MNTSKVTRFEVIDETGRVLTRRDVSVMLSLQDDERTLKVFLGPGKTELSPLFFGDISIAADLLRVRRLVDEHILDE